MKALIAIMAVLLALAVLNPDMRDFRDHVEKSVDDELASESGSRALQQLGAGAVALLAEQVSVRNDYFLFSTYTIDLDGPDRRGADWQYLGVAGMFIQLREPDSDSSSNSVSGS